MPKSFATMDEEEKAKYASSYLLEAKMLPAMEWKGSSGNKTKECSPLYTWCVNRYDELYSKLEAVGYELRFYPESYYLECAPIVLPQSEAPNRLRFDPFQTKLLLGLRVLYERGREDIARYGTVDSAMGDLLDYLTIETSFIESDPADNKLSEAMKLFERSSLVDKQTGLWADPETEFVILPCIKSIVSPERVEAYRQRYSDAVVEDQDVFDSVMSEEGNSDDR